MPERKETPENVRKSPVQSRSKETVNAILDAAVQFFSDPALGAITTNRIAERAGVSIGTLYQYFPHKEAIVVAAVRRRGDALATTIGERLRTIAPTDVAGAAREVIRILITTLGDALADKRWSKLLISENLHAPDRLARVEQIASIIAERLDVTTDATPDEARVMAFVLSRSILGAIRSAAIEDPKLLKSEAFEDQLVRLVLRFIDQRAD